MDRQGGECAPAAGAEATVRAFSITPAADSLKFSIHVKRLEAGRQPLGAR
jgi:hypothetical protein